MRSSEQCFGGRLAAGECGEIDGISVVIPAYNEKEGIGPVLEILEEQLRPANRPFEIIVVDDGSTDGTAEMVAKQPGIKVISHEENLGYGASLKTGIRAAKYDIIVITDADGTYPNERIPDLLEHMGQSDMVVGARVGKSAHIPLARRPAKWCLAKLANYLAGQRIPDLNSGLRAFRKQDVKRFLRILPDGFSFTTTITLALLTNMQPVKFITIDYHQRAGKSKIRPIRDTLNFVQLIGRTVMYFQPLKVFLPVAGLVFGLAAAARVWDVAVIRNLTDKTVLLFAAALQIAMLGLLADLIDKRSA